MRRGRKSLDFSIDTSTGSVPKEVRTEDETGCEICTGKEGVEQADEST